MKSAIEAILFAKTRGVEMKELKALTGLRRAKIIALLDELKKEYESRGVIILKEDARWRMVVRPELADTVKDVVQIEMRGSILKTLSIVAWKTPIKQSTVVKIRGNKAYSHVKRLLRNNFISAKKYGRTYILSTTPKFFDYFRLKKAKISDQVKEEKEEKPKVIVEETIYRGK